MYAYFRCSDSRYCEIVILWTCKNVIKSVKIAEICEDEIIYSLETVKLLFNDFQISIWKMKGNFQTYNKDCQVESEKTGSSGLSVHRKSFQTFHALHSCKNFKIIFGKRKFSLFTLLLKKFFILTITIHVHTIGMCNLYQTYSLSFLFLKTRKKS